jgi:ABC-type branched-subunit amino acid transport system substrate-binding protein
MVGLALAWGVASAGCSSTPNRQATHPDAPPIEAKSPQARASFDDALARLKDGEWAQAEEGFRLVQSEFPDDPIAQVAELYVARAKLGALEPNEQGALTLDAPAGEVQAAAVLLEGLSKGADVDDRVRYAARIYLALTRVGAGGGAKGVAVLEDYPGASMSGIVLRRDALLAWSALTEAFERANRPGDTLSAAATLSERVLARMDDAASQGLPESQGLRALATYASARAFDAAPRVDDATLHTGFLQDPRPLARAAAGWAILSPALDQALSDPRREALEEIYAITSSAMVQAGELERAAELSTLMATSGGPARLVVGVLAPLSGPNAAVGARVMRGAMLAGRVFEPDARPRLTVVTLDSADPPADNLAALERAGAIAVVGPVDKALVPTYAPLMARAQIPMVALSTESFAPPADGSPGDAWVFRHFISVEAEARAAAQLAVARFGDARVAVVFPEIGYGELAARVFTEHARALGAQVVASRSYDRGATDHTSHARALAAAKPQAIFIPDTGGKVAEITAFIAREGIWGAPHDATARDAKRTYVHYLGTSLWRDPAISGLTASYVDGAVFPVWFGQSVGGDAARAFELAHQRAFGARASLYEAFTYDAVTWLRQVVLDEGMRRGPSARAALTRASGFEGLTGAVRFRAWGEADRELRFVRVGADGFEALPFTEDVRATDGAPEAPAEPEGAE